mmetsp:Transcript_49329/g.81915  ORF Transcript_49329/g.81915 Transcript_49329/m.81915 type:complete len:318 (+) Transcript_49329:154-1107(+)|eukprot:CAMPEP_0119335448 /NCGR_PEP_ID=MMETSP1333-20130426/89630_1 /TAXON_ID=418940 /ORGANISM="Scyphosphaera apsteinii, Strain RCC1455" /LENGTH=317 /DNA_ID=CAMNT_0007345999 /DNA_START=156 /DNA_END=1109 /DNA_ORIENTATION=+
MAHLSLVYLVSEGSATQLPVHLSRPSAPAKAAVIVCHHGMGIYQDDFLKKYCDNLAWCGFLVALPDFYHRTWPKCGAAVSQTRGAGLSQKEVPVTRLVKDVSDSGLVADVAAVVKFLETDEGVAAIGVTGFCLGGRTAWLAACALPDQIKAVSMHHGGNISVPLDASVFALLKLAVGEYIGGWAQRCLLRSSESPFAMRSRIQCPVMGHVGELDANPSPTDAEALKAALVECGHRDVQFFVYSGARHGFCSGDSDGYQQSGSDLAWKRTARFLVRNLMPGIEIEIPAAVAKSSVTGSECTSGCAQIAQAAGGKHTAK